MPDSTVGQSDTSVVRRFVCWPEEQGPPEGWPNVYVDAEDWDRLVVAIEAFSDACDDYIDALGSERYTAIGRARARLRDARIRLEEAMRGA